MSVEARLQALVQNYRAQHGDAGLQTSAQLIAQLSSQAPDLYGEIRALSAAIGCNAAARIAASSDQDGEASKVATEIATSEKLSMAAAASGVAVARGLGPVGGQAAPAAPPVPPAAAGGWAGETVIAAAPPAAPGGYAPPPPQQPQPPYGQQQGYPPAGGGYVPPGSVAPPGPGGPVPIYKNKIAIGAAVAVLLLVGYSYSQRSPQPRRGPAPVTNGQTPMAGGGPQSGPQGGSPQGGTPQTGPQQGGQQGAGGAYPMLTRDGNPPVLQINRMQNGLAVPFLIETQNGTAPGGVILPMNGWDQGPIQVVFGQAGDTAGRGQIVNQGTAQMQRQQGQSGPARVGQVQWQQDGLGIGPICVSFQGSGQSQNGDVGLSGTTMCILDASCQQSAGCGQIRADAAR